MFGKESLMYALGGGAIAILAYMLAVGQFDAERKVLKGEHTLEIAKFDRDWHGARGETALQAAAVDEVAAAKARLVKAQAGAERRQVEKTAQEDAVLAGVRTDLKEQSNGKMDLDAALKALK